MGHYTLLADENSAYSKSENLYADFKAHLIYNIILNGDITFSDNQVMSSPNLRLLARRDGVIKELFKEGKFTLAVRDASFKDGIIDIAEIFEAFKLEAKLPKHFDVYDDSPEIPFIGKHAIAKPWSFQDVKRQFTISCKEIIENEFGKRLDATEMASLREWIAVEERRDHGGLGRAFLQNPGRLPSKFEEYNIMSFEEARNILVVCTDAVYLSNLPKTMALTPIYADQHRESFKLLRNFEYELQPFGDSKIMKDRLHWSHFKAGLNNLDMDDIHYLHQTDAFREFNWLNQLPDGVKNFMTLRDVYCELNLIIEDRIIQRFPGIARASPAPTQRQLRAKHGTAFEKGVTVAGDILALSMEFADVTTPIIPFGGVISDFVVDAVRNKISPPRPFAAGGGHVSKMQELQQFLEDNGAEAKISFDEEFRATSSFDKEIIVR